MKQEGIEVHQVREISPALTHPPSRSDNYDHDYDDHDYDDHDHGDHDTGNYNDHYAARYDDWDNYG